MIALLFLAGIPIAIGARSESGDRFQIRVAVFDDTDKPRLTFDATIVPGKDGTITWTDGGHWPAERPQDVRHIGNLVRGNLREGGKRIALKIDFSSRVGSDDQETNVICGQYIDLTNEGDSRRKNSRSLWRRPLVRSHRRKDSRYGSTVEKQQFALMQHPWKRLH